MRKVLGLALVTMLAGCSAAPSSKVAIMYNEKTKDTKECRIDPWATWQWQYESVLQQCVKGYEAAGYKRVDA